MILADSNTTNNILLYNNFATYIDKYLDYATNEEYVRNYSYKQIAILKLYCTFNLINRIYELSLLTDEDGDLLYTTDELISNYKLLDVAAELQKINININDILVLFLVFTVTNDLIPFKNKYQSLSRLNYNLLNQQILNIMEHIAYDKLLVNGQEIDIPYNQVKTSIDALVDIVNRMYTSTTVDVTTAIKIDSSALTTAGIDIVTVGGRAIRVGTKGTTYANSTALPITSVGGVLDTDPAKNYMVGVFTKVSASETTTSTDDLGSAWFRTRVDKGITIGASYSLYGVKSQLRIYADTALATSISNWAAAGLLGVLEVSGATTTFQSGCIAGAVYGNVSLTTTTVISSGAIVAALVARGSSAAITNTGNAYYGLHITAVTTAFDAGIHFGATLTHALKFAAGDKTCGLYLASITKASTTTAQGLIKIDVAGTNYYICVYGDAGIDNEWAD
jgi:hypothetical protein